MHDFVHLHVHTEYSLLDGANRIKDLLKHAVKLGMKSMAITDHGVMYGIIDFYKEAQKNGIKPIIGCEVYTAKRSMYDKQPGIDSDLGHLVLLAKNMNGYKNLMKIVSRGFIDGYYYKPRVDYDLLDKHSDGIIAMSACLSGDIPQAILMEDMDKARELATKLDNMFGRGNFYLEIQSNGIEGQNLVNQGLIKLSKETGIPLVATNDAHYLRKEDSKAHEILMCIQTATNINDPNRMRFSTNQVYVKSPDEMWEAFGHISEALENTVKIADMCNVEFEFGKTHLPEFDIPEDEEPFEYLRKRCLEGLKKRYEDNINQQTLDRLDYELGVIKQMGYIDYFLIVWDFIKYAKENGIMVGPGRGSAAGSLASYCLEITDIDPLKYNLIFERFLNPERISMPDIDIDFCYERRGEVIDYVVKKYGKDRVAQIITFGTMAARAAIRDVGRALDIPYNEVDVVAKMIPMQIGMNIEKALELNPDLLKKYKEDEKITTLIDMSKLLEGMPRHASTHAAGVVISKLAVDEYVPLQVNENVVTTQFTMGLLEELGLLKMDFLGLRTLTVIRDALSLIKENYSKDIDMSKIPDDDKEVYKLISEGKTEGVFQLESPGMTRFMMDLKPVSLEDIIAGISLYRPGPMDQIPRYIESKNNPEKSIYHHPMLEKILNVTYGCMVYQEQVMQIVRELGGYSMGRSDLVRRAMSKKKISVMEEERRNFIHGIKDNEGNYVVNGAIKNGVDEKTANKIFDEMMDFASYAFNKSHAAAYAVVAYQTAWLKKYYPVEFMAATLNSFMGSSDKVSQYIVACNSMGIKVMPPDINESSAKFTVRGDIIRFGLAAVKNVGENAVNEIVKVRKTKGNFDDFSDFCESIEGKDINKRCVESLIKCGAFDSMNVFRSKLMAVYERMLDGFSSEKKKNISGQMSIFGLLEEDDDIKASVTVEFPDIKEFEPKLLLSMEKEMLGLYISGHPLKEYEKRLASEVSIYSYQLKIDAENQIEGDGQKTISVRDRDLVVVGGIVAAKKTKTTKNNNLMAFIALEDMYGIMEILVFPNVLEKYGDLLFAENIVFIKGRVSLREDEEGKIICEEVFPINYIKTNKLFLRINDENRGKLNSVKESLKYFKGNIPVVLYDDVKKLKMSFEPPIHVDTNDELISILREVLGSDNVKLG